MADPVRPDPATRDMLAEAQARPGVATHIAVHGYLPDLIRTADRVAVAEVFLAGARSGADADDKLAAFNTWYEQFLAPPLPDEPPPGVYAGHGYDIWQRETEEDTKTHDMWWVVGSGSYVTWAEAYSKGADPGRRLVELPDPDDKAAVYQLSTEMYELSAGQWGNPMSAEYALRALAERGNHDG